MAEFFNYFDMGSEGTALTPLNTSDVDSDALDVAGAAGTGAVCIFELVGAYTGLFGMRTETGGSSVTAYMGWTLLSDTESYGRMYGKAGAFPAASRSIIAYRTGAVGASQALRIAISNTGTIEVRRADNTKVGETIAVITVDDWFRLEWHVVWSATVGTVELRLFLSPDSTTPTETLSLSGLALAANVTQIRWGVTASAASAPVFWHDIIANGTTDWFGPRPMDEPPVEVDLGGIVLTSPMRPSISDGGLPSDDVLDALTAGVVRVRRRVEIYEADGVTPWDIDRWDARLSSGTVTIDRDRDERRMFDILLENNDNALQINAVDGFWYDKILKAYWGILYETDLGTQIWDVQIGEFMIDRIDEDRFPHMVKVTGRDYTKKCLVSKIKFSTQFPQGTPVEDIIRALASNAGVTKFALPFTGQAFSRDIVFTQGMSRWEIMKKVAASIGYEVYFRGDGYLTMKPYADPVMSPLAWVFQSGAADGTLVDFSRSTNDSRVKNHVIVTGSTDSDELGFSRTNYAELKNEDPGSPTRIDRIGDRVDFFESDYITTQEQAEEVARQRMRIASLEEYEMNFTSVVLPWLDASTIVDIRDERAATTVPQRFLLCSLNLSLSLGPMSGVGRRVTITGSDQSLEYV